MKSDDDTFEITSRNPSLRTPLPLWAAWGPLFLLIITFPFSYTIDLSASRLFFDSKQFSFSPPSWCSSVYVWGLVPGQLLFALSSLVSIMGLFSKIIIKSRLWPSSIYLFFVLSLGSGLIAHGIFKEHFVRPRPKQIQEFGGKYSYSEPLIPYSGSTIDLADRLRSMPSGHATMGFYFLSFWFLGRRYSSKLVLRIGFIFGGCLGVLLTISRVLEGGHFITDGLAAFAIMWYTALILDLIWRWHNGTESR